MSYFLHEAIRSIYTNVVNIDGDDINDIIIQDVDGNAVTIDKTVVTTKMNQLIAENPMNLLREERNRLLVEEVDPIVSNNLRWNDMTAEKQTEWSNYRTALLDLPANQTPVDDSLSNITFPTKPN
jgi:hypothetical protein